MTYLYLILLTTGTSNDVVRRFEFKNYDECNRALVQMKIDNKKETTITAFCANEKNHRHYGSKWWNDSVKDVK